MRASRDPIRACALAFAAALVVAGCGGGTDEKAGHAPGPRLFGFNDNSVAQGLLTPAADAKLAKRAGANSVRVTMDWRFLERRPGRYDWRFYDKLYRAYTTAGLRPVWIPMFAPAWAGGACAAGDDCHAPPDRAHDSAYADLLARVAKRYPKTAGIEVWNEPNYASFWAQPDAKRYAQLLCAAYPAVKRAAPGIPVVSGGFGNKPVAPGSGDVGFEDYTTGVFRAGGGRCMDAIGFHPYPLGPDVRPVKQTFDQVRKIRRRFGFADKPLWVTEIGVSTTGAAGLAVTPREQAAEVARLYRQIAVMPDVQAFFLHTLIVPPGAGSDPEAGYGIFEANLQPKPVFFELRRARLSG